MINKNITTKENFDEHQNFNFVLFYNFFIKRIKVLVFDMYAFANINFMRKIERKLQKI